MNKPNCYKCMHRGEVPGSVHSTCSNKNANVEGHETGRRRGWFHHPYNFDPTWLISCDGYEYKDNDK